MICLRDALLYLAQSQTGVTIVPLQPVDLDTLRLRRPAPLTEARPGDVTFCGATARDPAALLLTTSPTLLLLDRRLAIEPAPLQDRVAVVVLCDNARPGVRAPHRALLSAPRDRWACTRARSSRRPPSSVATSTSARCARSVSTRWSATSRSCTPASHVYSHVRIGRRVTIHAGTILGADGFGYEREPGGELTKFPHLGGVVIEDEVEIGANTCIDRGTLADTFVGRGARIDNLVHLAHNTRVGEHAAVIAHAMVGGSTQIGARAWIAPSACLRDRIRIGDDAVVGLGSVVTRGVPDGATVFGNPARPEAEQRRLLASWLDLLQDDPQQ